jgi:prophage maintenance system killer protein
MRNRLNSEQLLLIAEATLGVPYRELEGVVCAFRAESALAAPFVRIHGALLFPDPVEQAAICAYRLLRTRPFPLGNRLIAYEAMREMIVLGERRWVRQMERGEDVEDALKSVETGELDLSGFVRWVRERVRA